MSVKSIIKLSQNSAVHGDISYKKEALGLSIGISGSSDTADTVNNTVAYARDEFMFIIEGVVEIKSNKTGNSEIITAGKSIVIPHGYDCQWHQQGYLRKFYVVFKAQKSLEQSMVEGVVYIDEKSHIPWQKTSDGHQKKILYQNNNQRFTAGVWQSNALTTGLINFPYHEFILIYSGSLICTDDMGIAHNFKRGDALFIPQGTRCAWHVKEKVSIHYVQIK